MTKVSFLRFLKILRVHLFIIFLVFWQIIFFVQKPEPNTQKFSVMVVSGFVGNFGVLRWLKSWPLFMSRLVKRIVSKYILQCLVKCMTGIPLKLRESVFFQKFLFLGEHLVYILATELSLHFFSSSISVVNCYFVQIFL